MNEASTQKGNSYRSDVRRGRRKAGWLSLVIVNAVARLWLYDPGWAGPVAVDEAADAEQCRACDLSKRNPKV